MSTVEEAFVSDIRANPDDDGVRLIYADWLEENGQSQRAEFIRVQIELARLADDDPRREALADRQDELLLAHGDEWWPRRESGAARPTFHRGLVEEVFVNTADECEAILRAAPIRRLRMWEADGNDLAHLVRIPEFTQLQELTVRAAYGVRLKAKAFARSTRLGGLTALSLHDIDRAPEVVEALGFSGHVRSLRRLDLSDSDLWEEGMTVLARSPLLAQLRELDLSGTHMGLAGLRALVDSPRTAGLTALNLEYEEFGPEGAAALARARHIRSLRKLNMDWNGLGDAGLQEIVRAVHWEKLRELELGSNEISDAGVEHLIRSSFWPQLTAISLNDDGITDDGAAALPDSAALAALTLWSKNVGPRGVRALAARSFPRLSRLCMWATPLGDEGLRHMLGGAWISHLTELGLEGTEVTAEGARALAACPSLGRLTILELGENPMIGDEGIAALAASPWLSRLRRFDLTSGGFGEAGAMALAASPYLHHIQSMNIRGNDFHSTGPAAGALRRRFGDRVAFTVK
jgi:uncharacterized protein (TIGR02996 family)